MGRATQYNEYRNKAIRCLSFRCLKLYCATPGLDSVIVPGAETSGSEAHEHGADEFSKGGGVHGF